MSLRLVGLVAVSLLLAGCSSITGPSLECHSAVKGKLVGVLHFADGRADTLRADPKVWADTTKVCGVR